MKLGFGLGYVDINDRDTLIKIDELFKQFLVEENFAPDEKNFLLSISPLLDDFLASLFCIEKEVTVLKTKERQFDIIYECKRRFVRRLAVKKYETEALATINFEQLCRDLQALLGAPITEELFAKMTISWMSEEALYGRELDLAAQYAAYMVQMGSRTALFRLPKKIDPTNLVTAERLTELADDFRLSFDYKDPEISQSKALNEAHYCIYCHNQGKDSCSKGFNEERRGCPLSQKISEMNYAKAQGFNLAALAIITLDNPLVAATGHRICNDCMKACIYQKQEPVNIPVVESVILEDVLNLPYGVEIYLLLTRWNPLNKAAALPKTRSGYNILIAGLGPAGIAISHYLLQEGHNLFAIEGLKVPTLPFDPKKPIRNWNEHRQLLSERLPKGFGGVAEYGITTRWDKNNLTLLRLILERRNNFKLQGSCALGSSLTIEQAFAIGFDYIAICTGAGTPKMLASGNFLAKGVLSAADFLMTLQSGGAFLKNSVTNLTLRMPILIIGGGLTAVDAATECMIYYPLQVERFLVRYEELTAELGKEVAEKEWTEEDKIVAEEFIRHALLFRKCRSKYEVRDLLQTLGGVTVYYRGRQTESPAYKLNHEEMVHAIASGVKFEYGMNPTEVTTDRFGHVSSVTFGNISRRAETLITAIGTKKATVQEHELISYFGDSANTNGASSVVKAIFTAKNGYREITRKLREKSPAKTDSGFMEQLCKDLTSTISAINYLSDNIIELIIHSPILARRFKPGQFFRLENYSRKPHLSMEPIALTGAYTDGDNLSLIILESGLSGKLCRNFKVGERVALMGPTGTPTEIYRNKDVLLVGGGLGNVTLLSIGKALRENGCHVTYIAGYKKIKDRFYPEKISESADKVIWCCEESELSKSSEQDLSIKGTVIDAIHLMPRQVEGIICAGSSAMMAAVQEILSEANVTCSINSPMQCMMKGICGRCIQKTTEDTYIFSCVTQDQDARLIDFNNLQMRLRQNSLQEKVAKLRDSYCKN